MTVARGIPEIDDMTELKYIWLAPTCDDCDGSSWTDRLWCEDADPLICGRCRRKPIKYKLMASLLPRRGAAARNKRLGRTP